MQDKKDFSWSQVGEDHLPRREELLKKHPKILDLYGYDARSKYFAMFAVALQIITCYLISDLSWYVVIPLSYIWGGTINHSLMLAIHELSHNLMFASPFFNSLFAIFCNFPIGIPYAVAFQKYHLVHHSNLGVKDVDPDLPHRWEGNFFINVVLKTIFLLIQPFLYSLRPVISKPMKVSKFEMFNIFCQVIFDLIIIHYIGVKPLVYLILSTFLGSGLHPMAGHFIGEHYEWEEGVETYSYYGVLNYLTYNVGYHNEHHDFPRISGLKLPALKKLVPEYYDNLPSHSSWGGLLIRFIFDSKMTPFSRILRNKK